MNDNSANLNALRNRFDQVVSTLVRYHRLLLIPAILGVVLAGIYIFFLRSESWTATQAVLVRDDLLGTNFKPGRFESLDSMKSAQETILEIARKPQVIRNALKELGPAKPGLFGPSEDWPSDEDIEIIQGEITLSAPNGAELGRTEVVVLGTKESTRERSRKFIELLLREIMAKENDVRARRFQSMQVELMRSRDAAEAAFNDATERLREIDQKLGADIGTMIALNDTQPGESPIKREIAAIEAEKRIVESDLEATKNLLDRLKEAQADPEKIVGISRELIQQLPSLEVLKKELITIQAKLATAEGTNTDLHPTVKAARDAVDAMKTQVHKELDASIESVEATLDVYKRKDERLRSQADTLKQRLVLLSTLRADYLALSADVKKRSEILNTMRSDLAEVEGLVSEPLAPMITPVDEAQVSSRPDGMGKKAILLAAGLAGLMLGFGMLLLVLPPADPSDEMVRMRTPVDQPDSNYPTQAAPSAAPQPMSGTNSGRTSREQIAGSGDPRQSGAQGARDGQAFASLMRKIVPSSKSSATSEQANATPEESPRPAAIENKATKSVSPSRADSVLTASTQTATNSENAPSKIADQTTADRTAVDHAFESTVMEEPTELPIAPRTTVETTQEDGTATMMLDSKSIPLPEELRRRPPNVRPVDLARSAEESDSFYRNESEADSVNETVQPGSPQQPGTRTSSNSTLTNPFLSDAKAAGNDATESNRLSGGMPEQIKKIRDTIANFSKPNPFLED